jgi:Kef-type K+ transport system membrane component KefB
MDEIKNSLIAAVASSFATVCMLIVFVLSATKETKSVVAMLVLLLAILVLTLSAIAQWVRYMRRYVNFTIDQKSKDTNKRPED